MRRYYIWKKTHTYSEAEDYDGISCVVVSDGPWVCLGHVDGIAELYATMRPVRYGWSHRDDEIVNSFNISLDHLNAAYLITDDSNNVRDFDELIAPLRQRELSRRYQPTTFRFRYDPVPKTGFHWRYNLFRHPQTTQEKREQLSSSEIAELHAEYPDARLHVKRGKRANLPSVYDDISRADYRDRCWKNCCKRKRQAKEWERKDPEAFGAGEDLDDIILRIFSKNEKEEELFYESCAG